MKPSLASGRITFKIAATPAAAAAAPAPGTALHRKGLDAVVSSIVDADELRSVNQIGPR